MAAKNTNGDDIGNQPSEVKTQVSHDGKETFVFFWGNKSPFSQWHPVTFVVDGIKYNCAEQYMMHQKAVVFKDDKMAKLIMEAKEPRKQKSLGRAVSNFEDHVWKQQCRDIVKRANRAKFSQNPHLKKQLLATKGSTLVEASPRDRIWGIGMGAQNPKAKDRRNWRGRNWLGYALTEVREQLMKLEKEKDTSHGDPMDVDVGCSTATQSDLPGVSAQNDAIKSKGEKFTFFWENRFCYSQWHPSAFTVDGVLYSSAEQYMMHQKAVLFKDEDIAEAVMQVQDPRKQKSFGRQVANFDEDVWNLHCRDIVKKGNKAKFSQNADMKKQLLATAGTTLVESSPKDTIWGIGLKSNDPRAQDRKTWRGQNWLGFALTEVREELIKEEEAAKKSKAVTDSESDSD